VIGQYTSAPCPNAGDMSDTCDPGEMTMHVREEEWGGMSGEHLGFKLVNVGCV